jgi:hypothetical protein
MIESSGLKGNIGLYELDSVNAEFSVEGEGQEEARYVRTRGVGNLVLELSDGRVSSRKVTNQNGAFSFSDVLPGRYSLKVVGGQIPQYHTITPALLELELGLGEERDVEIRVVQDRRRIHILEAAVDILLEAPGDLEEGSVIQEAQPSAGILANPDADPMEPAAQIVAP